MNCRDVAGHELVRSRLSPLELDTRDDRAPLAALEHLADPISVREDGVTEKSRADGFSPPPYLFFPLSVSTCRGLV